MSKDIKKLQINRLFKEFSFLKSDEEYKTEIQKTYVHEFDRAVKKEFKDNPGLNILFNSPAQDVNSEISESEKHKFIGTQIYNPYNTENGLELYTGDTQAIKEETQIDGDVKKLYRKIATKTHPDKVANQYLNDLYLKAQYAYEKNDIFTIYLICNDLNIEYEFNVDKLSDFKIRIEDLKNKNSTLEKTFLWIWVHEENEEIKKIIVQNFIRVAYKINF